MVCHRVFADWDAEALSGLTAPERQQLLALRRRMLENLRRPAPQPPQVKEES